MRLALLLLLACSGTSEPETSTTGTGSEAEAEGDAHAEAEAESAPAPECHVSCCSAEMLAMQRRAAAESGDGSIEQECCFCEPEPPRESAECVSSRDAITAAVTRSQSRACAADSECAAVTNPRHPDPEYHLVVHQQDAEQIRRDAEAHLERCGATLHHEAINAVRVVEPRCLQSRCGAEETTLHIEELGYSATLCVPLLTAGCIPRGIPGLGPT